MAVKLVFSPFATKAAVGVMEIAVKTDEVTAKVALLEVMPLADAVTVVIPCTRLDAMPLAFSVAIVELLDTQVTDPETLPELPSE